MVTSLQTEIGGFDKVAPYLKDPLVLVGFFLFLSFLFLRYLLKAGIVPPLPKTGGYKILRTILLYGFIIGILLIVFGFILKYKELGQIQKSAAQAIANEIEKNQNDEARAKQIQEEEQQKLTKQKVEEIKTKIDNENKDGTNIAPSEKKTTVSIKENDPLLTVDPSRIPKEVDFGIVTTSEEKTPLISGYTDAPMNLYGGDDFEYSIIYDEKLPEIVLYVGGQEYKLRVASSRITVRGMVDKPMSAYVINPHKDMVTMKFRIMSALRKPVGKRLKHRVRG